MLPGVLILLSVMISVTAFPDESEMLYKAIQKSNREIVLSLSPGPAHIDRAWQYCRYANMWRITDDFWDN